MSSTREIQNLNVSGTFQLADTGAENYIFGVSNLAADRTITLPLLAGNDTFVFEAFTQTLTNKTLTSPRIVTNILDTNGNELIILTATGSAINEITYANAAIGNPPTITASGDDTDVGLTITTKAAGDLTLDASGAGADLIFNSGTALSWPTADGTANQVIETDGAGVLSFATVPTITEAIVQTTDATVTTIATIATSSDLSYFPDVKIIARRSAGGDESAAYLLRAAFRNNAGTVTQIGNDDKLSFEDTQGWNVTTAISTTNILIQVTGAAATIEWKANFTVLISD